MKRSLAGEIAEGFEALAGYRAGISTIRGRRVILDSTENGALMAAGLVNSPRAIEVSIYIARASATWVED